MASKGNTAENALKSLYGKGHADVTRTRECVAMPGKREQTILTPQCIVDGLAKLWPEGVEFDPCPSSYGGKPLEQPLVANRYADGFFDGLLAEWPERTFCNPPYGELRRWLEYGEAFEGVVWLVPWRPHRKWFRAWLYMMDVGMALDPLKFHGFDAAYPAPLLLAYRGSEVGQFEEAFFNLGGVIWKL